MAEETCVKPTDPGAPWEEFHGPVRAEPGDAVISSSSGRLLINKEGELTEIKGAELSVGGYVEDAAAKGKTLGTYEVKAKEKARFLLVIFNITEVNNFGEIIVQGDTIAITERSGSVGANYKTTLTIVLPPGVPAIIKGSSPSQVSITALWESV